MEEPFCRYYTFNEDLWERAKRRKFRLLSNIELILNNKCPNAVPNAIKSNVKIQKAYS